MHALSPVLTLQGAVAHSDMPLESGPTLYLPYSHQYLPGYLAWRREDFKAYFAEHHVQLPLRKGDAGLLQPGAVPRRGLERLGRHPADGQPAAGLLGVRPGDGAGGPGPGRERRLPGAPRRGSLDAAGLAAAVAASAEGYPFPTNLDLDQPVDGLTPVSQAELVHRALDEGWEPAALAAALADYTARRRT